MYYPYASQSVSGADTTPLGSSAPVIMDLDESVYDSEDLNVNSDVMSFSSGSSLTTDASDVAPLSPSFGRSLYRRPIMPTYNEPLTAHTNTEFDTQSLMNTFDALNNYAHEQEQ